jgi:hypothetical protein
MDPFNLSQLCVLRLQLTHRPGGRSHPRLGYTGTYCGGRNCSRARMNDRRRVRGTQFDVYHVVAVKNFNEGQVRAETESVETPIRWFVTLHGVLQHRRLRFRCYNRLAAFCYVKRNRAWFWLSFVRAPLKRSLAIPGRTQANTFRSSSSKQPGSTQCASRPATRALSAVEVLMHSIEGHLLSLLIGCSRRADTK